MYKGYKNYTRFRKLERPDYTHECVEDFLMVIPYGIIIRIIKFSIDQYTYPIFKARLTKYEGDELERKIKKCSRGTFKILYFSFTFLFGWLKVLSHTPFHPPLMLGNGNMMKVFSDWPYTVMPEYMKFYYLVSMSYYAEDLVMHMFTSPNSDFWEMVLHHVVTGLLIFASYMNGFWNIGIFVLMQMDISDVFIGLIRTVMDFTSNTLNFFIYMGIMSSWVWFRFIAYTYCVVWTYAFGGRISVDNNTSVIAIIDILLVSLLALNIYWFILLVRMGIRLVFSGKSVDLQNVVSQKDVQM